MSTAYNMPSTTTENEYQPFLDYASKPRVDEQASEAQRNELQNAKDCRKRFVCYITIFIATSLLWMTVFLTAPLSSRSCRSISETEDSQLHDHNITSDARLVDCGTTLAEAKAKGCKFDVLLNAWVPTLCFDQDFIDEYKDDGSWAVFADEALTQQIMTVEEMSERSIYYTSTRDHVNHCATLWKKQFIMLFEERRAIDAISASLGHTDHCAQYLMDAYNLEDQRPTLVEVGYVGCWVRD